MAKSESLAENVCHSLTAHMEERGRNFRYESETVSSLIYNSPSWNVENHKK